MFTLTLSVAEFVYKTLNCNMHMAQKLLVYTLHKMNHPSKEDAKRWWCVVDAKKALSELKMCKHEEIGECTHADYLSIPEQAI